MTSQSQFRYRLTKELSIKFEQQVNKVAKINNLICFEAYSRFRLLLYDN